MSFQAYLDNIETETGKTPAELVALAREKGFDAPGTHRDESTTLRLDGRDR